MKQDNLGELLINLRKAHNYTQDDISNKMHVTRQAVSKWENNTALPDVFTIVKLGKLYNAPLLSAFYGEDFASEFTYLLRNRMFKRILAIWIAISTVLLIIFGMYYAFNHNAKYVYSLTYEDNRFVLINTYVRVSNNKATIQMGNLTLDDKPIAIYDDVEYYFYYLENETETTIIRLSNELETKLSNSMDYKDLFSSFAENSKQLYLRLSYKENDQYKVFNFKIDVELEKKNSILSNDDNIDYEKEKVVSYLYNYDNKRDSLLNNGFNSYDKSNVFIDSSKTYMRCEYYYIGAFGDYIVANENGCSYRISNERIIYSCDEFFKTICIVNFNSKFGIYNTSCAINESQKVIINYLINSYYNYHKVYFSSN